MMKRFWLLFSVFGTLCLSAQIVNDSTFQAVGYWHKGERMTYRITSRTYTVEAADTIVSEFYTFDADVRVVKTTDSTALIEWVERNFRYAVDSTEIMQDFALAFPNYRFVVETDRYGAFRDLTNGERIMADMQSATKKLRRRAKKNPALNVVIDDLAKNFATKEALVENAIKEIVQYYSFHGMSYVLGQKLVYPMQFVNMYGGAPFDAECLIWLDALNRENESAVLCAVQFVDAKQLTDAAFEAAQEQNDADVERLTREQFPTQTCTVWLTSQIHGSGWVVSSTQTEKTTSADGVTKIKERYIELK